MTWLLYSTSRYIPLSLDNLEMPEFAKSTLGTCKTLPPSFQQTQMATFLNSKSTKNGSITVYVSIRYLLCDIRYYHPLHIKATNPFLQLR